MLYTYDELNRLIKVDDKKQDVFDEMFTYDDQGRITAQRRGDKVKENVGGEYSYYSKQNRLKSVAQGMGGTADSRNMEADNNFVYDSEGNLVEDKSKRLKIFYDWRGMPIEFIQQPQPTGSSSDTLFKLTMAYDGSGRRISKTSMCKVAGAADWDTTQVTHYTGIGTEIRENYHNESLEKANVVVKSLQGESRKNKLACSYDRTAAADAGGVNMPEGLGRYGIEDAAAANANASKNFEWYLKNHLGSTMLVYGTQSDANPTHSDIGTPLAAYDYRSFGEQVTLAESADKVTENFTGKEKDDETQLDYFGARYLDPMLGMWTSVDPDGNSDIVSLRPGTNDINNVTHIDDAFNLVALVSNGSTEYYDAPPAESYFKTENLIGKKFDYTMEAKANAMIEDVNPIMFLDWQTDHEYDFKYHFYSRFESNPKQKDAATLTVGFLNGTIMTARDVGNAIWDGYTRNTYLRYFSYGAFAVGGFTPAMFLVGRFCASVDGQHLLMQGISNLAAGGREDRSSAVMQSWGFYNYKP